MKLTNETTTKILSTCETALKKGKLAEGDIADYLSKVNNVLMDYKERLGEEADILFRVRKRIDRIEVRMGIKGEKVDPFEEGRDLEERIYQKTLNKFVFNEETSMIYLYTMGYNVISIRSPKMGASKNILKQPMVLAIIFGFLVGLLCQLLPKNAMDFVINDLASPLLNVAIGLIAGITGPFAFLSILTAVSNLDSISSLNAMGGKILKRFLFISVFCITVYILVGMLFFPNFGASTGTSYDSSKIIDLVLDIIPTSLFLPFVNNKMPQMLILGIGIGIVILMLGDRASAVSNIISQLHAIVGELLSLVIKIVPIIPFLSIMKIVANGETATILMGWKYLVATMVCLVICLGLKIIKFVIKNKISFPAFYKKIKPAVMTAFATGSSTAALSQCYDISEHRLGIKPLFSSFWQPLSYGMLGPGYTIGYVLAPFMVAQMMGTPISLSFIVVLFLISLQLSMAMPGLEAALAIIFHCMGMPLEHVGLFAAYNVFIKNFSTACVVMYRMIEQTEVAIATDNIDMSCLKSAEAA